MRDTDLGDQSIYIFPTKPDDAPGFCDRAITSLVSAGLIEANGEVVNLAQFAAGDAVRAFLSESFEYLGVRVCRTPNLLPEDPSIEPRCPRCSGDLHEPWYTLVNDACDFDEWQDWSLLRLDCPHCAWRGRLDEIVDAAGVGAFLRTEFVFLDHISVDDDEFAEFGKKVRATLGDVEVKLYWYT